MSARVLYELEENGRNSNRDCGTRCRRATPSQEGAISVGLGGAAGDDRDRSVSDLSEYGAGEDADDSDGLVADQGGADHRVLHALAVRDFAHEMDHHVLRGGLPDSDDHLFLPRRASYYYVGSEVRLSRQSEEHTSELQSRLHLVCRLLLEKKKTSLCLPST